ncbi:MAG: rhomboid family intramembrane serine protease [Anaerolineae bacterium]|nr:rhomboid family intramembrane serine protease [Anaerolineae bacterium]
MLSTTVEEMNSTPSWRRVATDFRLILLFCSLVVILNSAVYALIAAFAIHPWDLGASRSNPLGVLTAPFVHSGLDRLLSNMLFLGYFTFLFVLVNLPCQGHERRKRSLFFALTVLPAAVATGVLFVVLKPGTAVGASGIAYAALGVGFGFSVTNVSHEVGIRIGYLRGTSMQREGLPAQWIVVNLFVFVTLFAMIIIQPQEFLGVGEGVDVFGHGVAFLIALGLTIVYAMRPTHITKAGEYGDG